MGTGLGSQPPLKVDPELLGKYGQQLQTAAGDLPEAPAPFTVTGTDAISQAIAEKLPSLEGAIQDALPRLKTEASTTASNVVEAAGRYSSTDAQLAADYEKHQFDSAGSAGVGAGSVGAGAGSMGQMGQMMSMPMQMAGQVGQLPMQAMGAVGQVPQSVMQGVQQIGQMAGGMGASQSTSEPPMPGDAERPDDGRDDDQAAAGDEKAERAPEPLQKADSTTAAVPQQSSPRHAAPDPNVNL
ncbi:type VII secretion target [Mycolicibacterium sp.]|uniref:type VII secretion target n=1 Tax=Mycolicibacterium sp. TaxID=2320850 RepID=UPI001A24A380|nr:type VII secretion target [Mycolicibacterium sp.]MBJ7341907.1 hypothetical protein [Mycolicibacterium sp.]